MDKPSFHYFGIFVRIEYRPRCDRRRRPSFPAEKGAAGPRGERTGRGSRGEGSAPRPSTWKLSASARQMSIQQEASVRVKQWKSQQIVANANAPSSVTMPRSFGLLLCLVHERQRTDIEHQPRRSGRREQAKRTEYAGDVKGSCEQKACPGEHPVEIRATIQRGLNGRAGWRSGFHLRPPCSPACRTRSAIPQDAQPDALSSRRQAAVLPSCRTVSR